MRKATAQNFPEGRASKTRVGLLFAPPYAWRHLLRDCESQSLAIALWFILRWLRVLAVICMYSSRSAWVRWSCICARWVNFEWRWYMQAEWWMAWNLCMLTALWWRVSFVLYPWACWYLFQMLVFLYGRTKVFVLVNLLHLLVIHSHWYGDLIVLLDLEYYYVFGSSRVDNKGVVTM